MVEKHKYNTVERYIMSNWTEEYFWDRQEAEQQSQKAMKNTTLGKFITALSIYYNEKTK